MKEFVIGSMYWVNPKATLDELRADMREVRDNGLTLLRTFLCWEYIEEKKGVFDFSFYDRFFKAAEEYDIKLMPTIVFYPPFYLIRDWLKAGIDDRKRRVPCIDHPEVQAALGKFIAETVQHYCKSPALKMWNIWNEPTDSICYCKDSIKEFVKFLHKKYKTMEELRESWAGEYYIFNPILPESLEALDEQFIQDELDCASRDRNTGIRLDWREFNMYHSAAYAAWIVHEIHKYDIVHECHSNPAQRTNPLFTGIDPYLFSKELDSVSGSLHPHGFCANLKQGLSFSDILPQLTYIDRFRSWGQGKDCYVGEYQAGSTCWYVNAYTPRGRDHFAMLFHSLARGLNGFIFWEWQAWRQSFFEVGDFSLRNPSDGGPTERSEAVQRFSELYHKHHDFFLQATVRTPEVAIFESMDQHAAETEIPNQNLKQSHGLSAMLCHRALASAGIKADFVTECLLDENVLSRYKVLILPHVQLISPDTAEKLVNFVHRGGAIWADGRCGCLDRHTFLRRCIPCNGLDELFGCREIDEVAPFPEDEVETKEYGKITPYRILQRLEAYSDAEAIGYCNGYPAVIRHPFGKGKTEYWGTPVCFGDVQNGTNFADRILVEFVRRNGVSPDIDFSGKGCLVSCIHTDDMIATVVTNDTASTTDFRIKMKELSVHYEEWTRQVPYTIDGDDAIWQIPAGETFCILMKKKCSKNALLSPL